MKKSNIILRVLLIAMFLFTMIGARCQQYFQKSYGYKCYDEAYSLCVNSDSNITIAGYTCSYNGNDDVYLLKVNSYGLLIWSNSINIRGQEKAFSVIESNNDSGITHVLTGDTHKQDSSTTGKDNIFLMITNSLGVPLLVNTYGSENYESHGRCVIESSDSSYVMVGYSIGHCDSLSDSCKLCSDVFLIKTDKSGNTIWGEYIDIGGYDDYGFKVIEANGKYIVTGYTIKTCYNADAFLMQVDFSGSVDWVKSYGTDFNDFSYSVKTTTDSGYIMVGHSYGYGSNPKPNILAIKTDINGAPQWKTAYDTRPHNQENFGRDVVVTDSGYYITGYSDVLNSGSYDLHLINIDNSGIMLWQKVYGDTLDDRGYALQVLSDGVVMTGYTYSYGRGNSDVYLVKTNFNGETCLKTPVDSNYQYLDSLYQDEHFSVDRDDKFNSEHFTYIEVYDQDSICFADSISIDTLQDRRMLKEKALKFNKGEMSIKVYPNPIGVGRELTIDCFSAEKMITEVQLINGLGKVLFAAKKNIEIGNNTVIININELNNGIYYLKLDNYCFGKVVLIK